MAWIRLSDNYIDHPKFLALSAQAFRLWHEGMAFCRKHQTDGQIAIVELHGFRYFKAASVKELTTPYKPGAAPLWDTVPSGGYSVHDYLEINLSKDEAKADQVGATARMRRLRAQRKARTVPGDASCSGGCDGEQVGERSPDVLGTGRIGTGVRSLERESERKPSADSKWPIFKGNRLCVFEWQLTQLKRTLGAYAESIEWDVWLDEADRRALAEPVVAANWWPWLQAELLDFARMQGWAVAVPGAAGKRTRLEMAVANIQEAERRADVVMVGPEDPRTQSITRGA